MVPDHPGGWNLEYKLIGHISSHLQNFNHFRDNFIFVKKEHLLPEYYVTETYTHPSLFKPRVERFITRYCYDCSWPSLLPCLFCIQVCCPLVEVLGVQHGPGVLMWVVDVSDRSLLQRGVLLAGCCVHRPDTWHSYSIILRSWALLNFNLSPSIHVNWLEF